MSSVPELDVQPIVLEGEHVRLEPMSPAHLDGLMRAGEPDAIWTWLSWRPRTRAEYERWMEAAQARDSVPFVTIERATGDVVGSTRLMAISPRDRRLEIGGTWLTPRVQRSAINTEAKYLQLRHCFDVLRCLRVELKTDARNIASQRAIARIGATQEGVFRKHMLAQGGVQRDSVYFSIIDDEWPAVRARLEAMLAG